MSALASAPGKIVLLGEYVVLDGASALVMAVDVRCAARLAPAPGPQCRLTTRKPEAEVREFSAGEPSGAAVVDTVLSAQDFALPWASWTAEIDSSAFFDRGVKLGLGSSAAALVAFAGVSWAAGGRPGRPPLAELIRLHRAFQGGVGSGIDVAAALTGGCLEFRLDPDGQAGIGSVRLPKSVGFAGIFAGESASTPDLVGRYRRWADSASVRTAELRQRLEGVAARGCAAVSDSDGASLMASIDEYGRGLEDLGREIGAELVTPAHREIGDIARDLGLAYKVSGAGGGDVGIACGLDPDALRAFSRRSEDRGFRVVPLTVDGMGLVAEEHAE